MNLSLRKSNYFDFSDGITHQMSEVTKLTREFDKFTGIPRDKNALNHTMRQHAFIYGITHAFYTIQLKKVMSENAVGEQAMLVFRCIYSTTQIILEQEDERYIDKIRKYSRNIVQDHETMSTDDFNAKYRDVAQDLGLDYIIQG